MPYSILHYIIYRCRKRLCRGAIGIQFGKIVAIVVSIGIVVIGVTVVAIGVTVVVELYYQIAGSITFIITNKLTCLNHSSSFSLVSLSLCTHQCC